jgi:hypothetical protein
MPASITSERSLPRYVAAPDSHESEAAQNNAPSDSLGGFFSAPRRALTNVSNRVAPPPGYTRHPQLRQKAADKGAIIGGVVGVPAGAGAVAFGIFGVAKWRGEGGYIAGKGAGYCIVGGLIGGGIVGAAIGYGIGYALGGIVDETLIIADHASHQLNDYMHHRQEPQVPDAAHLV